MNVSDMMTTKPVTIHPHNTLRKALETMRQAECHHLPVISADKHLVGILSDRDCRTALHSPYIFHEGWQDEELLDRLTVGSIMTPAPTVIEPNAFAAEAAQMMLVNEIHCLPVMRGETLIGIITASDILAAFVRMSLRANPEALER
jgi:acetoin utilization protein AcuB